MTDVGGLERSGAVAINDVCAFQAALRVEHHRGGGACDADGLRLRGHVVGDIVKPVVDLIPSQLLKARTVMPDKVPHHRPHVLHHQRAVLRQGVVDPVAGQGDVMAAEHLVHILRRAVVGLHEVPAHLAAVALGHLLWVDIAHAYFARTAARAGQHHHLVVRGVGSYQLMQLLHRDGRKVLHSEYLTVVLHRRLLHHAARKQHGGKQ